MPPTLSPIRCTAHTCAAPGQLTHGWARPTRAIHRGTAEDGWQAGRAAGWLVGAGHLVLPGPGVGVPLKNFGDRVSDEPVLVGWVPEDPPVEGTVVGEVPLELHPALSTATPTSATPPLSSRPHPMARLVTMESGPFWRLCMTRSLPGCLKSSWNRVFLMTPRPPRSVPNAR